MAKDKEQTNREREKQIRRLLEASTPEERKRIIEACKEGQALRRELEDLEQR